MKIHKLKIDPEYYEALLDGSKPYEIRLNDRGYKVGDFIQFKATVPYEEIFKITHVLVYPQGLKQGYVALSILLTHPHGNA